MNTSHSHAGRSVAPTTRSGRLGTWVTLLGTAVFVGLLIIDSLQEGPFSARWINLIAAIAILAGGAVVVAAMLRERERGLLAFVALVPFGLIVLAFLAELTGLME